MDRRQAMKMNGFDNYFLRQKFDTKKPLHFREGVKCQKPQKWS